MILRLQRRQEFPAAVVTTTALNIWTEPLVSGPATDKLQRSPITDISRSRTVVIGLGVQAKVSFEQLPLVCSRTERKRPVLADIVAKVENRATRKISRKLIFGLLRRCVAFQRHHGDPWSILDVTIWSLTSPLVKRTSGSKKFRSSQQKNFCNNIGTFRKWSSRWVMSAVEGRADVVSGGANRRD
jgi:hypothetical protein